jgi:hypothetical protein
MAETMDPLKACRRAQKKCSHQTAALEYIRALDHTLMVGVGMNLMQYKPAKRLSLSALPVKLTHPEFCPVLNLTMDEETSGWKAANLLKSPMAGLRVVTRRDPCHREWNDAMAAVRRAGLMPAIAKSMVFLNVNQAPWLSGAFMRQKAEALSSFLQCVSADDGFFLEHAEMIKFDHGITCDMPEDEVYLLMKDMPSLFSTGDIVPASLQHLACDAHMQTLAVHGYVVCNAGPSCLT